MYIYKSNCVHVWISIYYYPLHTWITPFAKIWSGLLSDHYQSSVNPRYPLKYLYNHILPWPALQLDYFNNVLFNQCIVSGAITNTMNLYVGFDISLILANIIAIFTIGEFPAKRPVTRSLNVFFDQRLNKRLSKQSWGWWFETLSRPLWRHCNVMSVAFIQESHWSYGTYKRTHLNVITLTAAQHNHVVDKAWILNFTLNNLMDLTRVL